MNIHQMYNGPFFSIIIPAFNRADFLSDTLTSVINQKFQDWECLLIDDGSTDNTKEVVNSFNDPRIKYYYKNNEERSIARNYGVEQAVGKYICFLDSDDLYYPNHLISLYYRIKKENFPIALFITGMNERRGNEYLKRPIYSETDFSHPIYFIWEKFILINSICVHKEILGYNKFPAEFNVWEDTHLWMRVVAQYPFYQILHVTTQWNVHKSGSVSKAFARVDAVHVKNYLNCVEDLFLKYDQIIEPYLTKRDKEYYQLKKLEKFLSICFSRMQYWTFLNLYIFGLRKVNFQNLNIFILNLLKRSVKQLISVP